MVRAHGAGPAQERRKMGPLPATGRYRWWSAKDYTCTTRMVQLQKLRQLPLRWESRESDGGSHAP